MKRYLIIGLLLNFSFNVLLAQNIEKENADSTIVKTSLDFELIIEHYNLSDTSENEFADYLIKSKFKSHQIRLKELNELPLTINNHKEKYLFRILSLPSFNNPICFTIIDKKAQIFISWSIGKGLGGYEPKGVKRKGRIRISGNEWNYFKELIDISSIDTLPLASYLPMTDGTSWIIEKNVDDNYKIYFSNILPTKLNIGFDWLLHTTGIKSKETIHFDNNREISFLDKNNILIEINSIREKIVAQLNKDFKDKLLNKDYCFDCGLYVRINSKEKIKSVKYIPYMLPHHSLEERFEYWHENYEDRRFRREVKKSLKKIDFQGLNLSKAIWIPVHIKYNENKGILEINKNNNP